MEKQDKITIEAVGSFPFIFYIEKAVAIDDDKDWIIEGIASTTNVDHDNERMSEDALMAMASAINDHGVPLRVEHQHDDSAVFGEVFKGWVDERKQLHMQARLNKTHPVSSVFHHAIKSGTKMGLSVGGAVKRAVQEFVESVGGMVKTFYDVQLQEVSVTPRPANYDSWLIAKSIASDAADAEKYGDNTALRRQFLFENSQLDYLQAFAKSIPDAAWRKVEAPSDIKKNLTTMDEKDKKKDEMDSEKAISRTEFNSLTKAFKDLAGMVSKGFENVGAILNKAMDGEAKDSTNPDKDKPKDESSTAKAETDEDETKKTADGTDEDGEREKSETDDETKEKAEGKDDTYDIETVNRSIKVLDGLQKRMAGVKKYAETETEDEARKAEDKEDDKTTTKSHPLDQAMVMLTKMMEMMVDRVEKDGKRILGFEKSFADSIVSNPEMQEQIQKMMKLPGQKKSVVMGVPYMVTKEGKRYAIAAVPERVEKSVDENGKPKTFRELYKSSYSSVSEQDAIG